MRKPWRLALSAIGTAVPLAVTAQADVANYPSRPIRIIVPQSPGASTDFTARVVAQRLSEAVKQPVVVDNRPGAGTIIGTDLLVRAAPDGHSLLVVAAGITINPITPWNGMFAPAKTPPALIARIHAEVVRVIHSPEARKLLLHDGLEPVGNAPQEFGAIVKEELARWPKVALAAGIKPQ